MENSISPLTISGLFTVVLYLLVFATALLSLRQSQTHQPKLNLLLLTAIAVHGLFLHWVIDSEQSQNVSLFNMMSLTNWLAMLILLINSLKRDVNLMIAFIAITSIVSTGLGVLYPGQALMQLKGQWASLLHIFAAISATGFLLLAAVQSLFLIYADKKLRSHPTDVPNFLPPLQSLESFLFQLLYFGFILMSVALIIAIFLLQDHFANQPLHKSVLATLAWLTFAGLIAGHLIKGWRGVTAAKWTLTGFVLLSLGYFGSKTVIELIL
ncbi:MAG: cytochrome c biogenesis protein CcsA, partial [Kangiellaceae bacterium]|nr:cytochrome c biogenesis protein CcsA [Kangiellaceae bacterium]